MCKSRWPSLSLFGAEVPQYFPYKELGKTPESPLGVPRLDSFLGSLIITSVSADRSSCLHSATCISSQRYIYIFIVYFRKITHFFIYICLSSGHSKHSRTPALICRFQMRLNKALFTEERERHEDLLSTFVHLNMQLYKLCKISQLKLLRLKISSYSFTFY